MTKTKTVKTALAAVTLAAAAFALPATASANNFNGRKCSDTQSAVIGGVLGGSLGTAIGEGIAGRGDKTEGAILGAVIGGIAGAAIGDGLDDCEKYDQRFRTDRRNTGFVTGQHNRGFQNNNGFQTVGHRGNARFNRGFNNDPLFQIDREIERTRFEGRQLQAELRNSRGFRPGLRRAIEANGFRLDQLKRERRQIKRFTDNRRAFQQPVRGHFHGNSRNQCFLNH